MEYTEEQKRAIKSLERNTRIIACSGSGKTEVISRRIAHMIKEGINPSSIVCFTFTNKAAEEMRARILKHINEVCPTKPIGDLFIGTIHSFCYELLREFEPTYRNYKILNENIRIALLANPDNFHRIGLDMISGETNKFYTISKFCESVDVFREELIDIEKVRSEATYKSEQLFPFIFNKYMSLLEQMKAFDFSNILFLCYHLLNDKKKLELVRKKYTYLVCDEYQDINKIQEKIINLIWKDTGNVCVVGDDDQAIYHWRGSDISNIIDFEERYPNPKSYPLSENFRGCNQIVSISNRIIDRNERLKKKMVSNKPSEKDNIFINEFKDAENEAKFIADKIEAYIGKKIILPNGKAKKLSYGDFAVLFRSVKNSGGPLIREFEERKIPFSTKGVADLFECPEIDFISKCFAYLTDLQYKNTSISLNDLCTDFENFTDDAKIKLSFKKEISEIKNNIREKKNINLQKLFHAIIKTMGIKERIFSDSILHNFGQFSELISDYEDINYPIQFKELKFFMGYIEGYALNEYSSVYGSDSSASNVVLVSTIHGAKGLQFGFVFIPTLNKDVFPTRNRTEELFLPKSCYPFNRYAGGIQEERRLFYVAITRAISYLSISSIKNKKGKNAEPSPFFYEFIEEFDKTKTENILHHKPEAISIIEEGQLSLSPSQINYYLQCPYDYKLRYVFGFNPGIDPAVGFGNQVHFILKCLFFNSNKEIPNEKAIESTIDQYFYLRYVFGKPLSNMKEKAKRMIKEYVSKYGGDFKRYLSSEKNFFFSQSRIEFNGQIDLIVSMDNGKLGIVDFKTGEIDEIDTQMLRQLQLYTLGLNKSHGYNVDFAWVHSLKNNRRLRVPTEPKMIERNINKIIGIGRKIKMEKFQFTSNISTCKACDFKMLCPNI